MSPTPEEHFRRYATRGDLAALGKVFDSLSGELFAVARRLAPASPTESAEDLVQATFLTALEKAEDYDASRPLAAWLVGILALHAKNARRKVSRRGHMASLDADRDSHGSRHGSRVGIQEPAARVPDPGAGPPA
ncbi:MAG: sigma-70 family RNA polymerase sigma factor, partial [Planctomycetota bacterium]|nr:sigma-70 family RNA polymerase sigma factor [Planctomycetota bacterium]